ncbi:MAG: UPF0182 family protein [Thaumarchaeota archaeon]|nr:UPF0182 family protein [Nitrososphaerota archaeon]MCL5317752.1 UPF0182 family protein [Nitrososphaerota archaeon]
MDYGDRERPPEVRRMSWRIFWILFIVIVLFTVWLIGGQLIWFWLNVEEFGELFTRPFFFETLGGFILATIALLRVDFRNRRSITWWFLRLILRVFRSRGEVLSIPPEYLDFTYFRLSPVKFALWQITKVLVGMTIFSNIIFGMAVQAMLNGWESNITKIPELFILPFTTPPLDMAYAQQNVVPMAPVLTLLISPILMVIGVRLILLVGVTQVVKVGTSAFLQSTEPGQPVNVPLATIEGLIALALTWTGVNLFFPSYIDYNTKYIIGGLFAAALLLSVFAFLDRSRRKRRLPITRRMIVLRIVSVLIIALFAGSLVTVQNSIADARKVEWMGPYTTQEISVNRYLAQLDSVHEARYNFSITPVAPERIKQYVANYSNILSKVRLWDLDATNAKLKPEIGLIPYVDFEDSDILRFNNTLYWSASMKPVLPKTIESGNRWFLEHMYYTHVPNGFLLLDGHEGTIVNSSKFFKQRQIYYGEGGLLTDTWAAYPLKSGRSSEVGDTLYNGKGGVDIRPPLSWIFDSTFLVSFPDDTIHALRYRDVYDRMKMLYPYFMYEFAGKPVDMYPVTDGKNTYWAMPLIVGLDGGDIPWSAGKPLLRQVGYALIDIYSGEIQIIVTGDDFFSQLFKTSYSDYVTTEVPNWLKNQTRYPEELFEWRISMYNYYHVTDPATFISAKDFFEVPPGLDTYYVISKPPLFNQPEFLGILSLQLKDSPGRNLAGYAVVRNDYSSLGQIIFYQVPLDSPTKLLGPTAVLEALQKDKDYAERKTLLSSAGGVKEGDNILYRMGDQDVYFIPVYTARSGGVITQLGLVAAVGATFTGQTFIGLGATPEEAFSNYLAKLGGVEAPPVEEIGAAERRAQIEQIFLDKGLKVVEPKEVHPDIVFIEGNVTYASAQDKNQTVSLVKSFLGNWSDVASGERILRWRQDSAVNYGVLVNVKGIVELHYISVSFEKPS